MLVSIVIDNYNYGAFVGRAIESALAQTHAEVEVIVVDDGSRDDSLAVIHRYADRVRIVAKPNGGQGSAYNAGFALARGELVAFLDADDWFYPEAMAEVVAAWRPGVSKLQFRLAMVGAQGEPFGRLLPREMHMGSLAARLVSIFGTYGSPPGSGNVFAASFLRQVLPMDEPAWRIGADSIPILLAPAYGEVLTLDRALGAYRIHRAPDDGALLYNNSINGLGAEYARMSAAKRMVSEGLRHAGLAVRSPLLHAPWEARFIVLGRRFGDEALQAHLARAPDGRLAFVLRSLWAWPTHAPSRRLALMAWSLAVSWLPQGLALRLARLHRRASGQPVVA